MQPRAALPYQAHPYSISLYQGTEDRFQYLVRRIGMRCLTPAELEHGDVMSWCMISGDAKHGIGVLRTKDDEETAFQKVKKETSFFNSENSGTVAKATEDESCPMGTGRACGLSTSKISTSWLKRICLDNKQRPSGVTWNRVQESLMNEFCAKKRNQERIYIARTPQQNGLQKKE
ncbi:hypothetical protein Tco_0951754 [Tanacetum coccineum]|uniref:Uncharacterized protein n=1 Tax=Tanacetum coccineum TaxID=301880 RepID=A0ABQ5DVY5_9ASTR